MKINLDEIKETLSKATPGEWKEFRQDTRNSIDDETYRTIVAGKGFYKIGGEDVGFGITGYISADNARLIANAPKWLASLVEQVEEMQSLINHIEQVTNDGLTRNEIVKFNRLKGETHDPK